MYIHRNKLGPGTKIFLRISARNGRQVRTFVKANLSKWSPDELVELEELLVELRRARGAAAKEAARRKVIEMVASRTPVNKWWRLFSQPAPPLRPPISKHNPIRGDNDV
jgi:hypothetical protein